jgi:chlorite dismutase
MQYRHFSGFNKESNFEKLSGDKQRAIETQANIDVEAHKLSRYYKAAMRSEETQEQLFNLLCNEYANKSENEIKKLVILDSKYLYCYPLTKDRMNHYQKLAEEKAQLMDKNIFIQTRDHFTSFCK